MDNFTLGKTPYSFPHQRKIQVNREPLGGSFLGINNNNWMAASRDLGATALRLYLYLAANRGGYTFYLSPEAIKLEIGMPRSTYHDQFKVLLDKGYLVPAHGNTYDFYEVPRTTNLETSAAAFVHDNKIDTVGGIAVPNGGKLILPEDIEIYKTNNIIDKKIDKENFLQKEQMKPIEKEEKAEERWELLF